MAYWLFATVILSVLALGVVMILGLALDGMAYYERKLWEAEHENVYVVLGASIILLVCDWIVLGLTHLGLYLFGG